MGNGLKDGYETETAHTQPEDDVTLGFGELTDIGLRQVLAGTSMDTSEGTKISLMTP